jgi:hypothetical protein
MIALAGAVLVGPAPLGQASVSAWTPAASDVEPYLDPDPSAPEPGDPSAIGGPVDQNPGSTTPPVHRHRSHHRAPNST